MSDCSAETEVALAPEDVTHTCGGPIVEPVKASSAARTSLALAEAAAALVAALC